MLAMAARPPKHHDTPYTVELVADRTGPVRCSSGPLLHAQRSFTEVVDADIVLVSSGIGYCKVLENSALLVWLGNQAARASRIGSIPSPAGGAAANTSSGFSGNVYVDAEQGRIHLQQRHDENRHRQQRGGDGAVTRFKLVADCW